MRVGDELGEFRTPRLHVAHWQPLLKETRLRDALSEILIPAVLRDLPPPMQLSGAPDSIPEWIAARASESEVYLVQTDGDRSIIGLLILAVDDGQKVATCHLGYLLGAPHWGQGYASELVAGLVAALDPGPVMRLVGGVAATNPASARVLEKHGFEVVPDQSDSETMMFARLVGRSEPPSKRPGAGD